MKLFIILILCTLLSMPIQAMRGRGSDNRWRHLSRDLVEDPHSSTAHNDTHSRDTRQNNAREIRYTGLNMQEPVRRTIHRYRDEPYPATNSNSDTAANARPYALRTYRPAPTHLRDYEVPNRAASQSVGITRSVQANASVSSSHSSHSRSASSSSENQENSTEQGEQEEMIENFFNEIFHAVIMQLTPNDNDNAANTEEENRKKELEKAEIIRFIQQKYGLIAQLKMNAMLDTASKPSASESKDRYDKLLKEYQDALQYMNLSNLNLKELHTKYKELTEEHHRLEHIQSKNAEEDNTIKCCICFEENTQLLSIPCPNPHNEYFCTNCYENIESDMCPICQNPLNE